MSDASGDAGVPGADAPDERPRWDDEYLDELAGRLAANYDLEADRGVDGERFDLYGRMDLRSEKHFLHPALSFARHDSVEHLFVRRVDGVAPGDVERLVALGHALADEWIEPDESHFSTEFAFGLVAPRVDEAVRSAVEGLDERTLLRFGYHGHYDVHVVVAAPDERDLVANPAADLAEAFRTWDPIERSEPGLLQLLARRLQL